MGVRGVVRCALCVGAALVGPFSPGGEGYASAHMKFDSVVFDLDGTLWDTTPACAVAWNNVVSEHGVQFREITGEDVRKVTGKPHDECIRQTFVGLAEPTLASMIEATAVADNEMIERVGGQLYPGVEEGLRALRSSYRLFIVSSCQEGYIETFLSFSGLGEVFEDFECFGNTGQSKAKNLASVIARNGLNSPLMVGDMEGDESAARACGIPFAHVTYGFGSASSPDYSFGSFGELVEALGRRG
jgi:phosphoglycolate phosphatase